MRLDDGTHLRGLQLTGQPSRFDSPPLVTRPFIPSRRRLTRNDVSHPSFGTSNLPKRPPRNWCRRLPSKLFSSLPRE